MSARRLFVTSIAIATIAAAWWVGLFTAAMVGARGDPRVALSRWPTDGAQAALASTMLEAHDMRDPDGRAGALAYGALVRSPVNAEAVRDIAMSRLSQGDLPGARAIIALGEGLSRRDGPIQLWLIEDRVQAGDVAGALTHYDRALRTQPATRVALLPVLAQAADNPDIARPLARLLASRPEWWSDFLGQFLSTARSPLAITIVLNGLHLDSRSQVDHARLAQALTRLIWLNEYSSARGLYNRTFHLQSVAVVDGGFEQNRDLPPIDWQLVEEVDRSATREPRDGARGNALSISGTEPHEVARQLLVLPPGRWRLQATSGVVGADASAPPAVSIACANRTDTVLTTASLPVGTRPQHWQASFTVPAGCAGQWLTIISPTSVGYMGESPWIDDISITRG